MITLQYKIYTSLSSKDKILFVLLSIILCIISIKSLIRYIKQPVSIFVKYKILKKSVFLMCWSIAISYFVLLNYNEIDFKAIFTKSTVFNILNMFLNISITLICIWFSLVSSQLSTSKLFILLLSISILITAYSLAQTYFFGSSMMLLFKLLFVISAAFTAIRYHKVVKNYVLCIKSVCNSLIKSLKTILCIYIVVSTIVILQLLCIANINKKTHLSFIYTPFLFLLFDWSYNFLVDFFYFCILITVYEKELGDFNNRSSYIECFHRCCESALEPTTVNLILKMFSCNINRKRKRKTCDFVIETIISNIYQTKESDKQSAFIYEDSIEKPYVLASKIQKIVYFPLRLCVLLISFGFIGLQEDDYLIKYSIIKPFEKYVIFFNSTITSPSFTACTLIFSAFVFTFFILSIILCYDVNLKILEIEKNSDSNVEDKEHKDLSLLEQINEAYLEICSKNSISTVENQI